MATSYTSLLGLALPVTGELSGTWGDTVNNSITSLLDTAIAGAVTVSADTTLTTTDGASNQARSAIIIASGHVANITVTAPARSKIYTIINTSATYTVKIVGVGPTTGVTLGVSEKAQVAWNGSDFVRIGASGGPGVFSAITNTSLTSGRVVYSTTGGLETDSANLLFNGTTLTANTLNLTNALGTTYGGTGLTSFTSGGVVYASSGSALSTGSALTFDGTNLGIGTSSPSYKLDITTAGTSGARVTTAEYGQFLVTDGTRSVYIQNYAGLGSIGTSSNNALGFTINSVEKMRLDSSGNLLLGTTTNYNSAGFAKTVSLYDASSVNISLTNASKQYQIGITGTSLGIYDGTASAYRMYLDSSGNLGIGTSSPSNTLTVQGSVAYNVNSTTDVYKYFTGGAGLVYAGTTTATAIAFLTSGSEKMRLDTSGNLGIGTSSPSTALTIAKNGVDAGLGIYNIVRIRDASSNKGVSIGYLAGSNTTVFTSETTGAASAFGWETYSGSAWAQTMTLDSSGNLGLGVTPSAWGSSGKAFETSGGSFYGFSTTSVNIANNAYYNGTNWIYKNTSTASNFRAVSGGFDWNVAASGTAGNAITFTQAMTLFASGALALGTTSDPTGGHFAIGPDSGKTTSSLVWTANTGGRLYVGKESSAGGTIVVGTDPYAGVIATNSAYPLQFGTNNTVRTTLDSSGNLGIGTTSPSNLLHIKAATNPVFRLEGATDSGYVDYNGTRLQLSAGGGATYFVAGNAERFRIGASGQLGIGGATYGTAGQVLTSGGSSAAPTWSTVTAGAGGSDTQIQYNSSGSLAGSANFTYNGTTIVSGANASTVGNLTGSFKSGRLLGTLTVAPTGASSPPSGFNYYMGYLGTTPIALSDANRVLKIGTLVNTTVSETYGQVAYGTTYGSKNAGMAFVSGTTNDALKVAINVAPLYTSDVNAVLLGYTVNGPRILIQNYALYDDSANVITSIADGHVWYGLTGGLQLSRTTGAFTPDTDNAQNLGGSSTRWAVVYAGTGTINTSDRNDKQDIEELSAAEQRAAVRVKGLIRKFRFKDSVVEKGDGARIHVGVIAQDVQDAFTAEGLDASRYGLFCSDTFKAVNGKPVKKDPLTQEYPEGAVDYTRLGVRYEELLAFVISAI